MPQWNQKPPAHISLDKLIEEMANTAAVLANNGAYGCSAILLDALKKLGELDD